MKKLLVSSALALLLVSSAGLVAAPPPKVVPLGDAQAEKDLALVPASDPSVTGAPQILAAMKGKHPRLLFSKEEMANLKSQTSADPTLQRAYDGTLQWSKIALVPTTPHPLIVTGDEPALVKSLAQAPAMAYAYALNQDAATRQRIITTLTTMAKEPYWADVKELDSSMGAACNNFMVGLLFDTVHDDLDPDLRKELAAKMLVQARRQYYLGHKGLLKFPGAGYYMADPQPNHRWYRDMGLAALVLSIADEPGIDASFMLKALKDEMDFVMKWYPPDGDCHEGAGYQSFGYIPIASATMMMDRVLGTTYLKTSGVKFAATQQMYYWLPGRSSDISYGDDQNGPGGSVDNNSAAFFFGPHLSRDKNMQAALLHRLSIEDHPGKDGKPPIYPWAMLAFYDPTVTGGDYKALPLSHLFPDMGAATMRDTWENNAVVMTFKCGPYGGYKLNDYREATPVDGKPHYLNIAHDDPDANEFAMALGNGFVFHPGVYSFVAKVTKQHNTLTVDDIGQAGEGDAFTQPVGDVDMRTLSYLTGWKTDTRGRVIIEGEAGDAYRGVDAKQMKGKPVPPPVLSKFRRSVVWMPGEYVLVLDNIAASGPHKLTWRAGSPKTQFNPDGTAIATTETGESVPYQLLCDQKMTPSVDANFVLDGRWGNVTVQQAQANVDASAARFVCLIDPWKRGVKAKMTNSNGTVTVTVQGGPFNDTWTWADTKDNTTPSDLRGMRAGAPLMTLTAADKAPKD